MLKQRCALQPFCLVHTAGDSGRTKARIVLYGTALLALLIAAAGTAQAQTTASPPAGGASAPARLPEVRVRAEPQTATGPVDGYVANGGASASKTDTPIVETPQAISVITRDRLEAQNASTLAEALRYTPGVQSEVFGFEPRFAFIQIRGFDATTTGLFRDGLRLSNPRFLVSYKPEPYSFERLEVPRGPASVLYGQASPGGLVNYISKRPTFEALREVGVEFGSFRHREGKFDLGGPIDDEKTLSYRLTGLLRDSDTQVDFIQDEREFIAPALTWRPSPDTSLTVLAHYQHDETRNSQAFPASGTLFSNPNGPIPSHRFTGEPDVDRYERTEHSLSTVIEHRFSEAWQFRQIARYNSSELDDVVVFSSSVIDDRTVGRSLFQNFGQLDELAIDNQLQFDVTTGALEQTWLLGLDYRRLDGRTRQFFGSAPPLDLYAPQYGGTVPQPVGTLDATSDQDQIGLYLQNQSKLAKRWVFQLGGRYDKASTVIDNRAPDLDDSARDDSEFTGRAGLLYLSEQGWAPYLSYSQSFLPAIEGLSAGGLFEPEKGEQVEAGLRYQPPGGRSFASMAVFDLVRRNYVQFNPTTFAAEQTGEARSRGLELEVLASLRSGLELVAAYTWQDVEVTETNNEAARGKRPTWVPKTQASLWLDYTVRSGDLAGFGVGGGVRHTGSTYGDDANTLRVPSATLYDAFLRYDWNGMRFALNLHNVFDKRHIAQAYVRGGSPFANIGQERTVTASVLYRW